VSDRFVFGLERVRELRVHDEDRAKEELAASLAHRLRGEAMLRAAEQRLNDAHALGRDGHGLTGAALVARQAWTERLERTRAEAAGDLLRATDEIAARRVAVADAGRARQALDRLRERKAAEHRAGVLRREGAELDEIALRGHLRGTAA
jgi:flagellar FliJ protein